ncbi:hypothetical protein D1007_34278 [Hordeum vulgare]|nr:hypothetical protein D1007_34278 [Hordeum vulgare]
MLAVLESKSIVCWRRHRARAKGCSYPPAPHLRPRILLHPPLRPRPSSVHAPLPVAGPTADTTLAWSGDPLEQQVEVFTVIQSSPAMLQEAALFSTNATVAWLDRDRRVATNEIVAAVCKGVGALAVDVLVVFHHPKAFLIHFKHPHHLALAVGSGDLPFEDTRLHVWAWRL